MCIRMEGFCVSLKELSGPLDLTQDVDRSGTHLKENVCEGGPDPARPAPANPRTPVSPLTPADLQTPADLRTPVKQAGEAPVPEPWTPTANLKMLISAASPDIRHRQMRKHCDVVEDEEEGEDGETKPSRKQRSLGLLCQKFLALYPDYPQDHNRYTWYGRQRLQARLEELQRLGQQQGSGPAPACPAGGGDPGDGVSGAGNRKDKSLRVMSQHFVSLFLVSESRCVRRLYDIANVLSSLSLIRKVHVRETGAGARLPVLGPLCFSPAHLRVGREAKMTRHASFNVPPTRNAAHRLVKLRPLQSHLQASRAASTPLQAPAPSSKLHPHPEEDSAPQRLAYLPSLSQPSVVLLYGGQRSPKRKREEEETEETRCSVTPDPALPSHYLYVPHNAGLNNINFLLSASQSAAGLSLPTLALPYLLLPSYPVAPGDAHPSPLGFLPPANFLVGGAGPHRRRGAELGLAPAPPSSPEHSETYDHVQTQPLTPRTPTEPEATPSSGGFFQTPRTLGSAVPAAGKRRRGSAQRRLDGLCCNATPWPLWADQGLCCNVTPGSLGADQDAGFGAASWAPEEESSLLGGTPPVERGLGDRRP
ncbi:hypothetical protein CRUP_025353 [Coryphaenoides rupestris]|nr:hypothetical protein CRUP_025353 [Coryphaenoides rupestris]